MTVCVRVCVRACVRRVCVRVSVCDNVCVCARARARVCVCVGKPMGGRAGLMWRAYYAQWARNDVGGTVWAAGRD